MVGLIRGLDFVRESHLVFISLLFFCACHSRFLRDEFSSLKKTNTVVGLIYASIIKKAVDSMLIIEQEEPLHSTPYELRIE